MKQYRIGETMSDEDSLAHYGVKGMKWGVRRGKKTTGVSRSSGALIDRNNRQLRDFKTAKAGLTDKAGASRTTRVINKTNQLTMGKKLTEKYYDQNIKNLENQNARLKAGKQTFMDRIDKFQSVRPIDLVVTVRPKD